MMTSASKILSIAVASTVAKVPTLKSGEFGLALRKNSNGVVVHKIKADGAFALTSLQVGQQVIAINGQECPQEVEDAIRLIKEAKNFVTVEAVDVLTHGTEENKKTTS
jgi:predicted metalloprotease with PDZ domain